MDLQQTPGDPVPPLIGGYRPDIIARTPASGPDLLIAEAKTNHDIDKPTHTRSDQRLRRASPDTAPWCGNICPRCRRVRRRPREGRFFVSHAGNGCPPDSVSTYSMGSISGSWVRLENCSGVCAETPAAIQGEARGVRVPAGRNKGCQRSALRGHLPRAGSREDQDRHRPRADLAADRHRRHGVHRHQKGARRKLAQRGFRPLPYHPACAVGRLASKQCLAQFPRPHVRHQLRSHRIEYHHYKALPSDVPSCVHPRREPENQESRRRR